MFRQADVAALGVRHAAVLRPGGPVLLVSFDEVRGAAPLVPAGAELAQASGWAHLAMLADGPTWWRDGAVHAHLDALTEGGFFDTYDRVVFHGVGMGGHAAVSLCVAAPGCAVVAVRPQATLDAGLAEWDRRFPQARRLDFAGRYGFAPDMLDGAAGAVLLYDPHVAEDAMHAGLLARPHVVRLRLRGAGRRPERALAQTGLVDGLLRLAAQGCVTAQAVHRLHRAARRRNADHLLRLLAQLTLRGRSRLARRVARTVLETGAS